MGASWQAFYAHLCAASIIRAMPETEIPPLCGGIFIMLHIPKPNLHISLEKNMQITQMIACVSAYSAL